MFQGRVHCVIAKPFSRSDPTEMKGAQQRISWALKHMYSQGPRGRKYCFFQVGYRGNRVSQTERGNPFKIFICVEA
jgi:hypothetical protein